jgi:GlcNAc-P-P-Und epimerase
MMKAFVTGGSGFIGTNLVADCLDHGIDVLNFDKSPPLDPRHRPYWRAGNILNPDELQAAIADYRPTHLVHLAARVDTDGRALGDYRDNTEGTANVLAATAAAPTIGRSVITSSQFVCRPGYLPEHDEDYSTHTAYGESKVVTEQLTRAAALPSVWTIVRPTTIWGPWLYRHRRQFFRVMKAGLYMHPGSGPVIRSWGYVGNVAFQIRGILEAPAELVDRTTFYVGDPPRDLLDWVNGFSRRIAGRDARIVPRRLVWALGLVGDLAGRIGVPFPITTARYASMTQGYLTPMEPTFELLGESPYTLEDGIEATLEWLGAIEGTNHEAGAAGVDVAAMAAGGR